MKKEYTVPANFDASIYTSHFKRSDVRIGVTEAMHYILDHIISYPIDSEKGRDTLDKRGGVPIFTVLLRKNLGQRNADKALQMLLRDEVLVKKEAPSMFKKKAALYVLGSAFTAGVKTVPSHKKTAPLQKKNVVETVNLGEKDSLEPEDFIPHLTKFLKDGKLEINAEAADFYIQMAHSLILADVKQIETTYTGKKKKEYKTKLLRNVHKTFSQYADATLRVKEKGVTFSRSTSNLRFNTTLTQLNRELRNFVQYDGKPMVQLDLTASQPMLLLYLLKSKPWSEEGKNSSSFLHNIFKHLTTQLKKKSYHMLCTLKGVSGLEEEVKRFEQLFEGDFYVSLQKEILKSNPHSSSGFNTRQATKSAVMYLLFEEFVSEKRSRSAYVAFSSLFPAITKVMDTLKSGSKNFLALLLQQLESVLIIDKITIHIAYKFPEAPLFTIHDAILTTPEFAALVKEEFKESFTTITGLKSQVKESLLDGASLNDTLEESAKKELEKIRKKTRKTKVSEKQDKMFPKLVQAKIPSWKGQTALTTVVWTQAKTLPLQKIIAEHLNTLNIGGTKDKATKALPMVKINNPLEVNESLLKNTPVRSGQIVPIMGFDIPSVEEEEE
ncbi:hypothetical protein SAMN06295967_102326 [Belliella buryatensis]|uniref:Uncharacterized protein n=1 Tax=Belliella buryatensis TaxID=1500549 RepID=A0A239BEJ2_9BACT|nr:hypothetical protein [Belliella buryatensis]SNS06360.1 hypothetical protein SAMN06295967_102326 [Belliella buryatensis]